MKKVLISLLVLFSGMACAISITNDYAGMKVIYSGVRGQMNIYNSLANNRWKIELTDLPDPSIVTGESKSRLLIKKKFNDPNSVMIESITADGPMQSITVNFPPGNQRACFVRNIAVNGFVNNIKITGGDLGDFEGPDGIVDIKGDVGTLKVDGKKYNVKNSKESQFWGGNIWADIIVTGRVKKLQVKGGNIHYDNNGGSFGKLSFGGYVNLISADGVTVKTDRADKYSKVIFGGGINSEIDGRDYQIKQIRAKGGTISSCDIKCRQIKKLTVTGQKAGKAQPFIPEGNQGIIDTYVRTTAETNSNLCSIDKILVKNGQIKNSLFAVKGHAKSITLNGEVSSEKGNVENTVVRAGFDGSLNYNNPPDITPQKLITSIFANTTVVIPFIVKSDDLSEKLTVSIRQRGAALDAVISNYNGQTFSGTNRWIVGGESSTGMFVWTSSSFVPGINSNIIVRVRDNSVPNLYADMMLTIIVLTNNIFLNHDIFALSSEKIPVAITTANGINSISAPQNSYINIIGYYEGNINKISVPGNSSYSDFIAGAQDYTPGDWQNANYIGVIKNITIKGTAISNIFVSRKNISISKRDDFDFDENDVWVSGTKDTD